jgi:UDP-glucose:(heptosyl)LPS alpha-1,3-glucosyltransferase
MKLALIRRQFSATGGAELYLQRLLRALAQKGHELHLFAEAWKETPAEVRRHPVKVSGTRAQRAVRFAEAVKRDLGPERFDCVFSLERTLRQDVYRAGDGVHRVWLERRRQFAPAWKRPFIGLGSFHLSLLRLETETFNPRNTRRVIVNSEMVKREILEHFAFPEERIHLVRNGVEVGRFQTADRAAARAHFGFGLDDYVLLFVGSGWERKGLKFLLRAMRHFRDHEPLQALVKRMWELRQATPKRAVLGGLVKGLFRLDETTQELMARLEAAKPPSRIQLLVVGKGKPPLDTPANVFFAGPLTNVELPYAAADLFVFLPIYEPCANVVVEALAAGLPVVTTAQNGAGELVEEGVSGSVLDDPTDTARVVQTIAYWCSRRFYAPPVRAADLSLDRNVAETLAILELAAQEKAG